MRTKWISFFSIQVFYLVSSLVFPKNGASAPLGAPICPSIPNIRSIELRLAAAEHLQHVRRDPNCSLGPAIDSTLGAVARIQYPSQNPQDFLKLSKQTNFLKTLINDSSSVGIFRKENLSLPEAWDLLELLLGAWLTQPDFIHYRSDLLYDEGVQEIVNRVSDHTARQTLEKRFEEAIEQPLFFAEDTQNLNQDDFQLKQRKKIIQSIKDIITGGPIDLSYLENILEQMVEEPFSIPIQPTSEKDLLPFRDLLREFSGNNKWTATDLQLMGVSLNLAWVAEALLFTKHSPQNNSKKSQIQDRIQFVLESSKVHDITTNPAKKHLESPSERGIYKSTIADFISAQINRVF